MAYHRVIALLPPDTLVGLAILEWMQERVLQGYRLEYCTTHPDNGSIEVAVIKEDADDSERG